MNSISGFVLTGGRSSRMGVPKAGIKIGERTMLERSVDVLRVICGDKVGLAGDVEGSTEYTVYSDLRPDPETKAPIFGLVTALRSSSSEWALILACDLPFVTADLLHRLLRRTSDDIDAVVPVQADGRVQALCGLYRVKTCLTAALRAIDEHRWSVFGILDRVRTSYVPFDELRELEGSEHFFLNVNTPEDLETARSIADQEKIADRLP